jgi:FixJ family two-component response regulator
MTQGPIFVARLPSLTCSPVNNTRLLVAVVDDEEPVRIALRRLLCSASLRVETFSSGAEFLESVKDHHPDCVVLDLHMPQVDGFAVQSRLKEAGIRLPTLVITADDTAGVRERALAAGAAAYLRKPVDDQALLEAITRAVEPNKHDKVTIEVKEPKTAENAGENNLRAQTARHKA